MTCETSTLHEYSSRMKRKPFPLYLFKFFIIFIFHFGLVKNNWKYFSTVASFKAFIREKKSLAKTTQNIMGFHNLKFVSLNSHYFVE